MSGSAPVARRLVGLALLAAGVYVFLPKLATAGSAASTGRSFRWSWLPALGTASALAYLMAALSLTAAAGGGLILARTFAAQLAAGFTNRLLPAGVGAMTTNVRYLERAGYTRTRATTAVGLDSAAGLVVHALAIGLVSAAFGATGQTLRVHAPDVPDNWELLVALAVLMPGAGLVLALARRREAVHGAARRVLSDVAALAHDRRRASRLLAASAGVTSANCLALAIAVQGVGGGIAVVSVVAVYVVGAAVAAAAPTPGGLGALEAGLIAGLTSGGLPAPAAVTAVLVYRLVTYWLPVLPGAACFWALRRTGAL